MLAVADGISTCDVGSGRLASWLTIQTLARAFGPDADAAGFGAAVADAARRSAASLLEWALEKGYEQQLRDGADLMGTTLTVAWLEGRELRLANLGDSRAYLIDEHDVEQLTVDGDLGSSLLGQGYPPETLIEISGMAAPPEISAAVSSTTPASSHSRRPVPAAFYSLPLLPGDILVLCTDGLVEEGMFLEPETLGHLVRTHRDRPAQQIAELLADSADTLQRLRLPWNPMASAIISR
ncbi:MAG: SpoIIE family protein phosphatase [Gemmataceae bacterium]